MSVASLKEIHESRSGSFELSDGKVIRRYTRAFEAVCTAATDDAYVVMQDYRCPRIYAPHPRDWFATARTKRAAPKSGGGKLRWIVTVEYSSEGEQPEGPQNENPLADPARITGSTQQFQRVYWKDRDDDAIANSAGDPFSDPVQGDDSRWVLSVQKNVASIPTWIDSYRDTVNDAAVYFAGRSWPAGTCKLMGISFGEWSQRNDIWYIPLTLEIAVDTGGWAVKVLDQGFRELDGAGGRKKIKDEKDGTEITSPALLNGSGAKISDPEPADGVYLTYDIYQEKDFSALPLR